jgi:hypothetical protein
MALRKFSANYEIVLPLLCTLFPVAQCEGTKAGNGVGFGLCKPRKTNSLLSALEQLACGYRIAFPKVSGFRGWIDGLPERTVERLAGNIVVRREME